MLETILKEKIIESKWNTGIINGPKTYSDHRTGIDFYVYKISLPKGYFNIGSTERRPDKRKKEHKYQGKWWSNMVEYNTPMTILYKLGTRNEMLNKEKRLIKKHISKKKCLNDRPY